MAESRDGCVVESEPLALIVHGFVERWNLERRPTAGRFGGSPAQADVFGALDWLSHQTGIPSGTIANLLTRNKRTGRLGRNATTELRIADPLIAAIGLPQVFHDGTLTLMQNPNASRAAREECRRCGGVSQAEVMRRTSLNGSLARR